MRMQDTSLTETLQGICCSRGAEHSHEVATCSLAYAQAPCYALIPAPSSSSPHPTMRQMAA